MTTWRAGDMESVFRRAKLDGLTPPPPDDPEAIEARVQQRVADLVEAALVKAHDEMGDGRRAVRVAMRWLATASPLTMLR